MNKKELNANAIITKASVEQLSIVQELAEIIWPATYGTILSKDQFDYMMTLMYSTQALENQFDTGKVFLLVQLDQKYVGFASYEIDFENSNATKVHKLYVLPETQGKGLGKQLLNYIKNSALMAHNTKLCLNVNRFNKAKDFYFNYGFEIVLTQAFPIGNGYVMDDHVLEYKL